MTNEELDSVFQTLREIALEYGLGWAVEQAEDQIRDGRTVALAESIVVKLPGRQRSSRIEKGTRTEPYTSLERLEILAGALRRAVVLPAVLEEDVLKFFAEATLDDDATEPFGVLLLSTDDGGSEPVRLSGDRADDARLFELAVDALLAEARA